MFHPVHVLLVEDNPADADLTIETIETLATSQIRPRVSTVVDGCEALDFLRARPPFAGRSLPDLILLDLNLPKKGGLEVLAELREDDDLCTIPVVVLTSSESENDIQFSYRLGANCYVAKPVGLATLQSTLRSLVGFWFAVAKLP